MSFKILRQLQYSSGSDYGNNLNFPPSRIIPVSLSEETETDNIIYYTPPRLCSEHIVCEYGKKLPEPSAYFRGPNTFIKSVLYLTNIKFYENAHLPLKANRILMDFLREKVMEEKKNWTYKKLIQNILNNSKLNLDTDPSKTPYFDKFLDLVLDREYQIVIIQSDKEGNYWDSIPEKLPKLEAEEREKKYLILLQNPSGLFSPYGVSFSNT
jgi:hypothetical protein